MKLAETVLKIAVTLILMAHGADARGLDAASFGWRMKEAKGVRPLLVIWVRQPDGAPESELARRKQYYEELLFGRPKHRDYPDALRLLEPTLVDYYRDQSAGQFTWRRAGFLGPLSAPVKGKSAMDIAHMAVAAAAKEGHLNFRAFDTNHDGQITGDELTLLIICNELHGQANHFRGRAFAIPGQDVTFAGGDGVVGEGKGLEVIAHELFHTLGGIDLYGPWHGCYGLSDGLTLMASSSGLADNEQLLNLDPWHKMVAGWIEPRLITIGQSGKTELAAQHRPLAAEPLRKRPLLIYDPAKGKSEFLLLEYRTPYRLGYDQTAVTSGLVIWHVAYGVNGSPTHLASERKDCKGVFVQVISVFVRGAPDWQQGSRRAYTSANGDIALKWMNGADSGVKVRVAPHKPSDPMIEVSWTAPNGSGPASPPPPSSRALTEHRP